MAQDLLTTYKYGWKTSYYQNTYDAKKDIDEPAHPIGWHEYPNGPNDINDLIEELMNADEEGCEACNV